MAKIRKRGNSYQIDYFDPNGRRVRKSFSKKKDAEAELGKRVSLIAENRYLDVKKDYKTTFKELLEKYEENFKNQPSFENWKRFCTENFKEHFGEETYLSNIHYVDLETYRNKLKMKITKQGKIRTDAAVNREMGVLRHIFRKALEWEMIEETPFAKGKSLQLKENNKRIRYLTDNEIQRLLAECPKHLRRIVECAINAGLRRSEILKLKWNDVNFKTGYIHVRESKTGESGLVPMNDTLILMFKEMRKEQGFSSEYVFTYRKSEDKLKGSAPVRKRKKPEPIAERIKSIKTAFNAAVRRAGIKDFKFHDLRHTCASHLIMKGASLKEVQEILRHKNIQTTMRYAHLSEEHKKKAVNLLNGLTASVNSDMSQNCHISKSAVPANMQPIEITGRGERI